MKIQNNEFNIANIKTNVKIFLYLIKWLIINFLELFNTNII